MKICLFDQLFGSFSDTKRERHRLFSAANEAQLGCSAKWHYEKCFIEILLVLPVIAGVFNVIATIYFQVAFQHGGSVQARKFVHECVYVWIAASFWDIIKMHFKFTVDLQIAGR